MATQGKRGRPKGTGINDRETLLKIAHLIAANPKMKRTTAIKQAGITNPSVVRRLRDKYQEQEHILQAEVAATIAKQPKVAQPVGASSAPPRGQASQQARPQANATAGTQQAKANGANPSAPIDPLAALFEGLSIETLVSQFIGHVLGIEAKQIEQSPITALIRQQAQLVDLVLPLLMTQFGNQKTAKAA